MHLKKMHLKNIVTLATTGLKISFQMLLQDKHVGMKPILIEHGWNMDEVVPTGMKKVTTWKELYNYIVEQGESNV